MASYRSWDFDRVYEFFSLLHRWCKKKEDLFHLLYDYTYLAGRDHFETSPLCDKDGTHRLNPYHTQESFLTSLCTTFTWLSFWACHIISKGKMEVDEPTKARVLTAKWMPYLWTTKKLIYYLLFFFFVYFWNTLCNFLLLLLLCNIVIFIIS